MIQMSPYCFSPPDISHVALCSASAEKIIAKIKLSGKILLLFQCQSHRTSGNAVPEGKQSRCEALLFKNR